MSTLDRLAAVHYQPLEPVWEGAGERECHAQRVVVNSLGFDADWDCDYSGITDLVTWPGGTTKWTCPNCGTEHHEEREDQ